MRVAIFGLGYVGCVTAACLAERGHEVVGVDVNPLKVSLIGEGRSPILEPGLSELVRATVDAGRLRATDEHERATRWADLSLVCVGTPSARNGSLDVRALERVVDSIGAALRRSERSHTVVLRSTMLPGTCEDMILPRLEAASGLKASRDFGVAVNPEFLREGSSIADFRTPAKTVIGEIDDGSGAAVASLYEGLPGHIFHVPIRVAEMTKYAENAFHALKIGFTNEIGVLCRELGSDAHQVMEILCSDSKLNISSAYMRPGFAFGGSCLPKDLRALLYAARRADVELPLLDSVLPSNEKHLQRAVELVLGLGVRRIGIIGLSFKPETDDLRESPMVELCERLLGKGMELKIYDPRVMLSRLVGSNREYIVSRIPHLSALLVDTLDDVLEHAEALVLGAPDRAALERMTTSNGFAVVDLVAVRDPRLHSRGGGYIGIAW